MRTELGRKNWRDGFSYYFRQLGILFVNLTPPLPAKIILVIQVSFMRLE